MVTGYLSLHKGDEACEVRPLDACANVCTFAGAMRQRAALTREAPAHMLQLSVH